jgi:fermentation-respiration switch protein FrsA (DUF1100 family)
LRRAAFALTAVVAVATAVAVAGCGGSTKTVTVTSRPSAVTSTSTITTTSTATVTPRPAGPPFAIGQRVVTFVDRSRTVRFPGRAPSPRRLVTIVRYPTGSSGPFPLVVFGHGFAVTPRPYAALLDAWARAGYVVAAPVFPLENARAPGGPNESDLVNQPRDMSVVITGMLASRFFGDMLDRRAIAVSGQSDGGETALAVAYDRLFLDRRIRAAAILSGAKIPGVGGFDFPAPSPPLLATQGTADTINPPSFTHAFFDAAPPPKYLLTMLGAPHLGPYTSEQPQLGVVERVTIAFFDRYLKAMRGALRRMVRAGDVRGVSHLLVVPG